MAFGWWLDGPEGIEGAAAPALDLDAIGERACCHPEQQGLAFRASDVLHLFAGPDSDTPLAPTSAGGVRLGSLTLAGSCFPACPAPGFGPAPSLWSIAVQLVTKADTDAVAVHSVTAVQAAGAAADRKEHRQAEEHPHDQAPFPKAASISGRVVIAPVSMPALTVAKVDQTPFTCASTASLIRIMAAASMR